MEGPYPNLNMVLKMDLSRRWGSGALLAGLSSGNSKTVWVCVGMSVLVFLLAMYTCLRRLGFRYELRYWKRQWRKKTASGGNSEERRENGGAVGREEEGVEEGVEEHQMSGGNGRET